MDQEALKNALARMPIEIRIPIKKLKNDQNWAVYLTLLFDYPMYYTQLEERLGANPTEINRALKDLVSGGLIDRQPETLSDIGNSRKTFYSPTPHGKKLYNFLIDAFEPQNREAKYNMKSLMEEIEMVKDSQFGIQKPIQTAIVREDIYSKFSMLQPLPLGISNTLGGITSSTGKTVIVTYNRMRGNAHG